MAAVVHLRLGDVSDAGDGDSNWEQGGQWHSPEGYQYVKGRAYYEEVLRRLGAMPYRPTVSLALSLSLSQGQRQELQWKVQIWLWVWVRVWKSL